MCLAFIDLPGLDLKDLTWYQMAMRSIIVFVMALIFIRLEGMRSCVLALMYRLSSFLSYRSRLLSKFSQGRAILLFSGGRRIEKQIAKHSVTHTDLLQALHEKGVETFDDIQSIWLEPDRKISIIKKQRQHEKNDQQAG